jgi:hypothetical protein
MMRVVVLLRLLAATMPMSAITMIAPTMIHVHGTVLVVVVVVVVDESGPVDFCVVVADPVFGAAAELLPAAGPLCVVVVLEPLVVPAVCAKVIAGAIARNSASRMKLSRKIDRMWVSRRNQFVVRLLAQENAIQKHQAGEHDGRDGRT